VICGPSFSFLFNPSSVDWFFCLPRQQGSILRSRARIGIFVLQGDSNGSSDRSLKTSLDLGILAAFETSSFFKISETFPGPPIGSTASMVS